ncbi:3-keto-5-aminohexanoate cleavage protein [Enterovirga rhinocerotis]|uniref:Uncharacterized protein (DUF849 family) n=1 Tax=Enterovirga rhinocerotis TaxID=1339210 RepID=A0A4R7C404_9HYPH|nr:3-keto-5-aminohexanoate cleavage protein [Enterovirga rhinocerotis]TDR93230.1 uncharacterized protein (DUF849 family) [Enterovirga rhinocerotis]
MTPLIIEARINEYAMRDINPHVPWTADEIAETAVRCREAGASILHYHARRPDGGPENAVEANAEIIAKVRARCDILIHPTLGFVANDADPASRIDTIIALAADPATKPDFAPLDTGSANVELYDPVTRRFSHADRIYENRTDTLIAHAGELKRLGIKPILVSWAVGFTRRAFALVDAGLVGEPVYLLFHMTDGVFLTGHPGTEAGLDAHLAFLPSDRSVHWTANVLGGNLLALADTIIRRGGNLSIGIGDYPYGELGAPPNEDVIRRAAGIAHAAGRPVADVAETKRLLRLAAD